MELFIKEKMLERFAIDEKIAIFFSPIPCFDL